jgi:hypothetical protein
MPEWVGLRMLRRMAVLVGAALVLAGCGSADGAQQASAVAAAATTDAATQPADTPATATGTPRPSDARTGEPRATTRSPRPRRTATATTTTRAPSRRAAVTVKMVARGDPLLGSGRIVQAMDQVDCGEDDEGVTIHIDVADPARVAQVWFTYRVGTKQPFSGEQHDLTARGDLHYYHGIIGPFEARPENAGGGSIAVVAHVLFTDGRKHTGRGTFTLKPCR